MKLQVLLNRLVSGAGVWNKTRSFSPQKLKCETEILTGHVSWFRLFYLLTIITRVRASYFLLSTSPDSISFDVLTAEYNNNRMHSSMFKFSDM